MDVRRSGHHGERDSPTVREHTPLDAELTSVGRVGSRRLSTERGLGHPSIHRLPLPVNPSTSIERAKGVLPRPREYAGLSPLLESIVDSARGSQASWERLPLDARAKHIEDRGETPLVVLAGTATPSARSMHRENGTDPGPESVRERERRRYVVWDGHSESLTTHGVNQGLHSKGGFPDRLLDRTMKPVGSP
jgi:hypothetical protein